MLENDTDDTLDNSSHHKKVLQWNDSVEGDEWVSLAPLHEVTLIAEEKNEDERRTEVVERWRRAADLAVRHIYDPWRKYNIHNMPVLRAKRFRYSAIKKVWTEDIIEVKMCLEPFARGAMRECFRLKKLPTNNHVKDWANAQNYVAKRYIQQVEKQVVFDDVRLQMDCKLWAEEFNRYNPPKKIDIVQMCVLQIIDFPEEPYYHLEHFIEGDYVKYNSNSGFVSDLQRKTPQAFTHFTFERSGHQMIVVDIQGVGDLYTDPQIHTVNGTEYGDGNLGTRGMALFFHSHVCNDICHVMCLTEFDLSSSEHRALAEGIMQAPQNMEPTHFERPRPSQSSSVPLMDCSIDDAMETLRQRSLTLRSRSNSLSTSAHSQDHDDDCMCDACLEQLRDDVVLIDDVDGDIDLNSETSAASPMRKVGRGNLSVESADPIRVRRRTVDSMCSSAGGSSRLTGKTERDVFWANERKKSVPAGVINALQMQLCHENTTHEPRHISILGQIHLDLARYHEAGRFVREEINEEKKKVLEEMTGVSSMGSNEFIGNVHYDREAALFHLDVARRCGNLEAILTVAQMTYGMPHELLKDIGNDIHWFADSVEDFDSDPEKFAFELMLSAAEMGDREAILFVAECFETGQHMGMDGVISYPDAIFWLERSMGFADDEEGTKQHRPRYELLANVARLYQEGGHGLSRNLERAYELYYEAADAAVELGKGKVATKYYEYAEICAG